MMQQYFVQTLTGTTVCVDVEHHGAETATCEQLMHTLQDLTGAFLEHRHACVCVCVCVCACVCVCVRVREYVCEE